MQIFSVRRSRTSRVIAGAALLPCLLAPVLGGTAAFASAHFVTDGKQTGGASLNASNSAVDPLNSDAFVTTGSVAANGLSEHTITVRLADSNGDPVDPLTLPKGEVEAEGVSVRTFTKLDVGLYTAKVTSRNSDDFDIVIIVDDHKVGVVQPSFYYASPDAEKSDLLATDGPLPANGKDGYTLTLHLKDEYGVPVDPLGKPYTFKVNGVEAAFSTWDRVGTGIYTSKVRSVNAGKVIVGVRVDGGKTLIDQFPTLSFAATSVDAKVSSVSITSGSRKPDGNDRHTVTVHVKDAWGNLIDPSEKLTASATNEKRAYPLTLKKISRGTYEAFVYSKEPGTVVVTVKSGQHQIGSTVEARFGGDLLAVEYNERRGTATISQRMTLSEYKSAERTMLYKNGKYLSEHYRGKAYSSSVKVADDVVIVSRTVAAKPGETVTLVRANGAPGQAHSNDILLDSVVIPRS